MNVTELVQMLVLLFVVRHVQVVAKQVVVTAQHPVQAVVNGIVIVIV